MKGNNNMNNKIQERIMSDYNYLCSLGYNVLGVFLQGSQNYGCAYEDSDIDTKAIIIPKVKDFCLSTQPKSTTIILDNNEHIDVKDIRPMFECVKKQNVNFLEFLFTDYYYVNPAYSNIFNKLFENAEKIARYDKRAFLGCIYGMGKRYNGLFFAEDGYNCKALYHIVRVSEILKKYLAGETFANCIKTNQSELLRDIKRGKYSSVDAFVMLSEHLSYINTNTVNTFKDFENIVDKEVENILDGVLTNIIVESLKAEIN